ncbi:MAG: regulatory protein RecX [Desulfobacteraceae bacterium]|jgi:regulatory protein
MDSDNRKSCYHKALQLLTGRDHSCAELTRKLQTRGFDAPVIEAVIVECQRLNYLDDKRFADGYVSLLQRKGYGINSVKHKLYAKGISETLIQDSVALSGTDKVQLKLCRRVLAKKVNRLSGDKSSEDQAPKLYRYLFNRGFPAHIIRQTIREMIHGRP